ncbi:retrotransposon protein, putative, ty1-copia subclass [Tanacetum coccineum]|uniref:Retrotransposon protein, putative, ty1-copia subclass n=1 Tax=Tanacetum coccineum TaxID=301880 RepID=A0ABQ5CZQ7_9ASTR
MELPRTFDKMMSIPKSILINLRVAFHAINARCLPLAPLVYTLVRPPMTSSLANNSVFRGFFEKQKLTGPNFIDWYRQLRVVLAIEDKLNYLEQPLPPAPVALEGQQVASKIIATHTAWIKGSKKIVGLMLMTMEPEIQQNLENLHANDMLKELKTLFAQQAEQELLQTMRDFHSCKQEEGSLMGKIVNELHAMLKLHEQTLPKNNALFEQYLAELLKRKKNTASGASGSGIFAIELNTFLNISWIYDIGCGTHICNTTQGLRASRKLKPGALSLYVGNGQHEVVEAIGVFHLCLPSGLEIVLNNCHYAPTITRGVISVSRLYDDGYDGIFEIDLYNSYTNVSSIYAVSNKRAKLDLDSALLWHCRLGHISKKHIEKLQHDGLLNATDLRAFEKCISCMCGKMARKPYTHHVERAKDLLGLIHTDRRNRTLLDMVRSMMSQTTLLKSFWDYALETAACILNMVPTKKVEKTPYKVWHGQAPKLSYLKVWGCEALIKRDTLTKPDKLKPTSIKCIFIGYPKETMGYSFYYPPENRVLGAGNAEFLKNSLITQEASRSLEDLEIIQEEVTHPSIDTSLNHKEDDLEIDEPQSDIVPIRRSTRTRHAPDRMCLYIDAKEHNLGDLGEPANYKAALLDPESDKWLNAMNVEMQSMKDNKVLDLVDLPPNGKTVGSKWLFKKKTDMDGDVHTYKACLVAKGYTQTPGIDYEETFSPVVDIRAIRILIAIAAYYDYKIWQMDVKTAFLNGHLLEEVYMQQPEGFVNLKYPNRVCKLKSSIYGLKQASRQWNKRFDNEIKKFGFTQNRDDPCVYLKASEAAYILRIKIYRDRSRWLIGLFQSAYIEKILKRFHMKNSKRGSIPMQENLRLSKSEGALTPAELKRMQNIPYTSTVDSIMVSCYTDAGYLTDADDIKSQTGYVFILNGDVVDWKSANQSIFATSSTEVEAIAIAKESGITKGARHFRMKVHYLHEVIEFDDIKLEKVYTDDKADPFTKALAFPKHSEHARNIRMLPASSFMQVCDD